MHSPHIKSIGGMTDEPSSPAPRSSRQSGAPSMGVYVHFPWCLTKCPYCDFLSIPLAPRRSGPENTAPLSGTDEREVRSRVPHELYADAILHELQARSEALADRRVTSIFFGGGTPSLWDPAALGRVLAGIRAFADPAMKLEITVEGNPSSLDRNELEGLVRVGVNRFSIGVQSLDRERLAFLGRAHDADEARTAVRTASQTAERVSADLIYGVHGQKPEAALSEALEVLALGPGHLSAYSLTIEENTRFGNLHRKGRLPLLTEDLVAESYQLLHDQLTARGFEHYEISNYAQPGQRSLHNEGYWRGNDYLGLGIGAVGTVTLAGARVRYKNHISVDRYLAAFGHEENLPASPFERELHELEPISPEISVSESILLGLRTQEGVDLDFEGNRRGVDAWTNDRRRAVEELGQSGLLLREGTRLKIPEAQWILADRVIRRLL